MIHTNISRCAAVSIVGASVVHSKLRLHHPRNQPSQCGSHVHCDTAKLPHGFSVKRSELISTLSSQKLENIYEIQGGLGAGGFATVHIARHKLTGVRRAIKILPKANTTSEVFRREAEALSELDHPNIIKVIEYLQDDKNYYVVQELCTGPDVLDYIANAPRSKVSEREISIMFRQCIKSVIGCHAHGFVHRDIKLENFMVTSQDMNVKLIDFGLSSRCCERGTAKGIAGTDAYMAPEMIYSQSYKEYGKAVDVWSLGATLYSMLTCELFIPLEDEDCFSVGGIYDFMVAPGQWKEIKLIEKSATGMFTGYPMEGKVVLLKDITRNQLRHNTLKEVRRFLSDEHFVEDRLSAALRRRQVSTEAMDLLRKMLSFDPSQRITTGEALRHPFILQYDREDLNRQVYRGGGVGNSGSLDKELETKLRHFVGLSRLEQTAFLTMAHLAVEGTMEGNLIQIRHIFRRIDVDGDGEIDLDELKKSFAENNLEVPRDIDDLFKSCDISMRRTMSYVEFVAMQLASLTHKIDEKLCTAGFLVMDRNHSGELQAEDLAVMCRHLKDVDFRELLLQAEMQLRPKEHCVGTLSLEDFHRLIRGPEAVKLEPPRMPVFMRRQTAIF